MFDWKQIVAKGVAVFRESRGADEAWDTAAAVIAWDTRERGTV
jgi:hypothetical protein